MDLQPVEHVEVGWTRYEVGTDFDGLLCQYHAVRVRHCFCHVAPLPPYVVDCYHRCPPEADVHRRCDGVPPGSDCHHHVDCHVHRPVDVDDHRHVADWVVER